MKKEELEALKTKFEAAEEVTASDARELHEALGKPTHAAVADLAWVKIQALIKAAVLKGENYAEVSLASHHSPFLRAEIEKRLAAAGFKNEVYGSTGWIFW